MKPFFLTACALGALSCVGLHAENLVENGDFETGKGTAFSATPPWYNRGAGLNQGANARSDKNAVITGVYSATINDRYNLAEGKFGPLAHAQKTTHTIAAGDSFTLSYEWRPVDEFWQTARDTVRFVLYATADDKLGGPIVWSAELTADFFKGSYKADKSVLQKTGEVSAAAVGKKLFVTFHGMDTVDGVNGSTHYARVDNIVVKVAKK